MNASDESEHATTGAMSKVKGLLEGIVLTPEEKVKLALAMVEGLIRGDELSVGDLERQYKGFQALSRPSSPENEQMLALREFVFRRWAMRSTNTYAVAYRLGDAMASKRIKSKSIMKAVTGRRLIGSASRAKVQKQAEQFRHMSKDSAAPKIANIVGLSPGTVRRYLTELYPGQDWKA
jgi:hypothetical protein